MIRVFGGTGYIVMKPQIAMLFATLLVMPTLSAAQEAGNVVQPRAMPDRRENDQAFSGFVSVGPGIAPKYAGSKNTFPSRSSPPIFATKGLH